VCYLPPPIMPDGAAAPRAGDAAADGGGGGPGHAAAAAAGVTILSSVGEMVAARERLPAGTRVGLVATMGALHGGHLVSVAWRTGDGSGGWGTVVGCGLLALAAAVLCERSGVGL